MKLRLTVVLLACLLFWNCNSQNEKNIQNIAPRELSAQLNAHPDAQLIDVRTPAEYASGRIGNAVNIDWNGDQFEQSVAKLDKNEPVYVYCKIGGRSAQAADKLSAMGFTKIYNLDGGILKWEADGLSAPLDKVIGMHKSQYDKLIASDQKVLVNFYATWCEPCKRMAPYMETLGEQYKGKLTVSRLNADEHKTLVREMKIDALPAILLYENGKIVWKHNGFISEADLKTKLQ